MKELSIEQKAKRYDEAIEIARQYYNDRAMPIGTNFKLERMFPELKESEDEKIRKELISFVRGMLACHDKPNAERDEKYESWIAWLEKQAEQKHTPKHKIGDTIYYNSFGEVKSMVVSDVAIDGTDNPMYEDKDGNAVFEKDLIEQKPTDKAESKFKQGDWIIFNGLTLQVKGVVKGFYITTSKDGITNGYDWSIDNAARLWTIQDAKDGDVLSWDNGRYTIIFKESKDNKIIAHCSYNNHSKHFGTQGNYDTTFDSHLKFVPGTKEQCDTLLKAIADARYTIDFEKKELKKIEQKSVELSADDLPEFESYLCLMFQKFRTKGVWTNGEIVDFVKEHSQKLKDTLCHVWGEEDENRFKNLIELVEQSNEGKGTKEGFIKFINRLKSLKERTQPQPRQEWSGEEQQIIKDAASFILASINTVETKEEEEKLEELADKLQDLRPQTTYRPSEEQIETLKCACGGNYVNLGILESLYNDLKKL